MINTAKELDAALQKGVSERSQIDQGSEVRSSDTVANGCENPPTFLENARKLSRKGQALEVSVFLFLIVPSTVLSLFTAGQWNHGFVVTAAAVIVRDIAMCSLVLYFLWRNADPFQSIGWTFSFWPVHVAIGIFAFPVMFFGAMLAAFLFMKMGLSLPQSTLRSVLAVRSWSQVPLAVLLVAVVAVTEETIFRGYLLLRLKNVSGNMPFAVVVSTVVFAMGHGYEGQAGIATIGLLGLFFTLMYVGTNSLVAPVVLHFLQDLVAVVVVPMLTRGHQ